MNEKQSDTNRIDTKKAIVCFMDILGYGDLVCNETIMDDIYRILNNCLKGLKGPKLSEVEIINTLDRAITKQMIGDAFLFVFEIEKIPKEFKDEDFSRLSSEGIERIFISFFLSSICRVFIKIIAETKYFIRGGITLGQYHQRYFDNSEQGDKFIFSKALAEAHELEKRANVPRIVLSNDLYKYIPNLQKKYILKSIDGLYHLDPYCVLSEKSKEDIVLLKKVVKAIEFQIDIATKKLEEKKGEKSVFEKYR